MLILPLDYSEPYFATLGVMLYPAVDDADPPKARAYVAQVLARAFRRFREAGGSPPYDVLAPVLPDAGEPLSDLQERWWGGRATGELFKTFFALYNTDPALASWAHAIQIVELITENSEVKGSRTTLLEARDRFLTVAHLWGARAIRGGGTVLHPEIGYDERADFQWRRDRLPERCDAQFTRANPPRRAWSKPSTRSMRNAKPVQLVLSQKHEGWVVLPALYDDGGFSGGTMDRPALQRLLDDIRAGQVDVVVVYKIDRLTRSLFDFAKIVEAFDPRGVSFVSITQQFNTTTSMGRLTLNVLLSFAQFEREVAGERIRDKIAASKKKGMWMGGLPSLGYDVQNRKLVVNEEEAGTVVHIFRRYVEFDPCACCAKNLMPREFGASGGYWQTAVRLVVRSFAAGPSI